MMPAHRNLPCPAALPRWPLAGHKVEGEPRELASFRNLEEWRPDAGGIAPGVAVHHVRDYSASEPSWDG